MTLLANISQSCANSKCSLYVLYDRNANIASLAHFLCDGSSPERVERLLEELNDGCKTQQALSKMFENESEGEDQLNLELREFESRGGVYTGNALVNFLLLIYELLPLVAVLQLPCLCHQRVGGTL